MRSIAYLINDKLPGHIQVDTNKCKIVGDLEQYIKADCKLNDSHIVIFENPSKETPLRNVDQFSVIIVSISDSNPNIYFKFQGNKLNIKASAKKEFPDIVNLFKKVGFYYSKQCIQQNLRLSVENKDLTKNKFPLFGLRDGTFIDVDFFGNIATLEYGNRKFFFSENELARTAIQFIKKIYEGCSSINIYDKNKKQLNENEELRSDYKYKVNVNFIFKFRNVETDDMISNCMDFLSKVIDAQKFLSDLHSNKKGVSLKPEIIRIYTVDGNEELEKDRLLKNVQHLDNEFWFEIWRYQPKKAFIKKDDPDNEYKGLFHPGKKKDSEQYFLDEKKIFEQKKEDKKKIDYDDDKKKIDYDDDDKKKIDYDDDDDKKKIKEKNKIDLKKSIELDSDEIEYDKNKKEKKSTEDNNKLLIMIIFENPKKNQYPQLRTEFSLNTTIKDIKDMITNKYKIEDKINIKYKDKEDDSMVIIDQDITLEDIRDDMKEKEEGKYKYFLYVDFQSPKKLDTKPKEIKEDKIKKEDKEVKEDKIKKEDKVVNKIKKSKFKPKTTPIDVSSIDETKPLLKNQNQNINKKSKSPNEIKKKSSFNDDKNISIRKKKPTEDSSSDDDDSFKPKKTKKQNQLIKNPKKEESSDDEKMDKSIISLPKKRKNKYRFQTNRNNEIGEIELGSEATVKTMKILFAKKNKIKNPNNIKIIFAGKELLDDLSLESLEIGDTELFVYIRSEEDILLLTAKALKI